MLDEYANRLKYQLENNELWSGRENMWMCQKIGRARSMATVCSCKGHLNPSPPSWTPSIILAHPSMVAFKHTHIHNLTLLIPSFPYFLPRYEKSTRWADREEGMSLKKRMIEEGRIKSRMKWRDEKNEIFNRAEKGGSRQIILQKPAGVTPMKFTLATDQSIEINQTILHYEGKKKKSPTIR